MLISCRFPIFLKFSLTPLDYETNALPTEPTQQAVKEVRPGPELNSAAVVPVSHLWPSG